MFEITGDEIALLSDESLRELVGRLCEAEVRSRSLCVSCVTYGGHQNAADGGLDVRVALSGNAATDFIPRSATGFQVKRSDIQPSKILAEMRPNDVLRTVIRQLADQSGAYIIVSASSTSDKGLQKRRRAMTNAVSDLRNAGDLALDFYDRTRLATWVRSHPGLIPWLRQKIGKVYSGWRSYGAWAFAAEGVSGEYLLDDKVRIQTGLKDTAGGVEVLEGIQLLRDRLREPRSVIRIVGLSGVGKTRFVEALFDDRIGKHSLDPSIAFYCDVAGIPNPQPTDLASDLIALHKKAILVIDNCPPDLHRRLSELCRSAESSLSVVTVEYDVREDQPEGTEVFRMGNSSAELVQRLVRHRFPSVSFVDAQMIARFSDGNARVALALAGTIGRNETIARLTDEELFQRLFQQRHGHESSLLVAARACSMVYSFDGENISDVSELSRLGRLIEKSPRELFESAAELQRRGLVQKRGFWRAVLPDAIANRLATTALDSIPSEVVEATLIHEAPERLLRSFSRRLGYLNESSQAREMVARWLEVGGMLGDALALTALQRTMIENIAPIAPQSVLRVIERGLASSDGHGASRLTQFSRLIRSLAYDASLFDRCVALLSRIAQAENAIDKSNKASDVLASLFYMLFSGTHAKPEERLRAIEALLSSDELDRMQLGLKALKAALETSHFTASYGFEFGARSRDYGYWPRTKDDAKNWFRLALACCENLVCSGRRCSPEIRGLVAKQFRSLWNDGEMYDELDRMCHVIAAKQFWPEGWLAVRETLHSRDGNVQTEISARLRSLEMHLRPTDLGQKVRSIVLSQVMLTFGTEEDDGYGDRPSYERAEGMAECLGRAVAADKKAFSELMPELLSGEGRLWSFGRGLVEGALDPVAMWNEIALHLANVVGSDRNVKLLRGFIRGLYERDPVKTEVLLDDVVHNETLAPFLPALQVAVPLSARGVDRLMRSLGLAKATIGMYRYLAEARALDSVSGSDLRKLVLGIAAMPGGIDIAAEILAMRVTSDRRLMSRHLPELVDVGCELMKLLVSSDDNISKDCYYLGEIISYCLTNPSGEQIVREICRKLKRAISKYEASPLNYLELLAGLFSAQPIAALDELLSGDSEELKLGVSMIKSLRSFQKNPLSFVPGDRIVEWCDREREYRYETVAALIEISSAGPEPGTPRWTDLALRILSKAPDRVQVLKQFVGQFDPLGGWIGERSATLKANLALLDQLGAYTDSDVVSYLEEARTQLAMTIEEVRR